MERFNTLESIEQGIAGKPFRVAGISNREGCRLKKIYVQEAVQANWVAQDFPHTEVVGDIESILEDGHIDLVLVAGPRNHDLDTLAQIVRTGKHVRIV